MHRHSHDKQVTQFVGCVEAQSFGPMTHLWLRDEVLACWVEGGMRAHMDEMSELLGVSENLHVWSAVALGRSAMDPPCPPKPQLKDVLHYNLYKG